MQPPPHQPLIERVVGHPAVRSGYASLLAHLLLGIVLTAFFSRGVAGRRAPLELAFGTDDVTAGNLAAVIDIAVADPAPEAADATERVAAEEPPAEEPVAEAVATIEPPAAPVDVAMVNPTVASAVVPPVAAVGVVAAPAAGQSAVRAPSIPRKDRLAKAPAGSSTAAIRGADAVDAKPFTSRRGAARAAAVNARGGSADSERAVELGLKWLAEHQAVDGSWQFDLSGCRCNGGCRNPGTLHSSTASTAIAILPFLGAGNTHLDGPYQETVSRAIYYLLSRMQPTPRGGDFCEGTLYGHGVTTLALAEAYGLTADDMLLPYLRDAIRFIQTSQDQHGGGWRYLPGQAGDTTVTAWQVAALKSAAIAGIETPSPTIEGVRRFLDSVQANNGATYGYRTPQAKPCTSAVGLLCRMYTGWGPEQEALSRGVTALAKTRPPPDAVYQNFYLAQALLLLNHPVWPRWNRQNRDQLVALQARFGHETGSWFFSDPDTAPGGRLAHTALAVLTLEVYYRLLPIYTEKAVQDAF